MVEGDIVGFLASALVLATFAMKDMQRLRATAILSNIAFIAYGGLFGLLPVLLLHLALLPLNVFRFVQEARRAPAAHGPSKAMLLAVEALHFARRAQAMADRQAAGSGTPEVRTRPHQLPFSAP